MTYKTYQHKPTGKKVKAVQCDDETPFADLRDFVIQEMGMNVVVARVWLDVVYKHRYPPFDWFVSDDVFDSGDDVPMKIFTDEEFRKDFKLDECVMGSKGVWNE